jgi:hypothetical protein
LALVAGTTEAHATTVTPPYADTSLNTPLTNLLQPGDYMPGPPAPTVPGFTYPAAWNDGAKVIEAGRVAGRFAPALRTLGTIGLVVTGVDLGLKVTTGAGIFDRLTSSSVGDTTAQSNTAACTQCTWAGYRWRFLLAGQQVPISNPQSKAVPQDGWYEEYSFSNSGGTPTGGGSMLYSSTLPVPSTFPGTSVNVIGSSTLYVRYLSESAFEGAVTRAPITSADYNAYPAEQRATLPPSTGPFDLAPVRTAVGDPIAGKNGVGQVIDTGGHILSPGQVVGQIGIDCALDPSWCAGGINDPTRPPRAPGTLPEDPRNPGHPDPGDVGGPLADVVVMPNCIGAVVAVCTSLLDAAGFTGGARTFDPEDLNGADITKPAGSVVTQSPGAGTQLNPGAVVHFDRNPDPDQMPLELLKPGRNETYDEYLTRLRQAGWLGTVTYVDLNDTSMDTDVGPQAVSRIRLNTTGTGSLEAPTYPWPYGPPHPAPLPSPLPTPQPPPRILPSTPITIVRNPVTAPVPVAPPAPGATPKPIPPGAPSSPGADTPPGDGSPGTGDATCPCTVRAIDWGPLEAITVGTAFPFGLWTWLSNGVAGWGSATTAPVFDLPLYGAGAGKHVHVDLAPLGPVASLWRAALAVLVTILALWNFASRQMGDGDGEGLS